MQRSLPQDCVKVKGMDKLAGWTASGGLPQSKLSLLHWLYQIGSGHWRARFRVNRRYRIMGLVREEGAEGGVVAEGGEGGFGLEPLEEGGHVFYF